MKNVGYINCNGMQIFLSNSYRNVLEFLDEITTELQSTLYKGPVVFDNLLSNGFTFNRFMQGQFDGEKFIRESFKVIDRPANINNCLKIYYTTNVQAVENSILTRVQQQLVKKGIKF